MKIGFFPAAVLFVVGILMVVLGSGGLPGGGLAVAALGIVAMTAGAALEIWSRQRS